MGNSSSNVEEVDEQKLFLTKEKYEKSSIPSLVEKLSGELFGEVVPPTNTEKYTEARTRPWNHDQRGFPALIFKPRNAIDVSTILRLYNSSMREFPLCIASGCHRFDDFISCIPPPTLINLSKFALYG